MWGLVVWAGVAAAVVVVDLYHGKSAFYGKNGRGEELCASDLKRNG